MQFSNFLGIDFRELFACCVCIATCHPHAPKQHPLVTGSSRISPPPMTWTRPEKSHLQNDPNYLSCTIRFTTLHMGNDWVSIWRGWCFSFFWGESAWSSLLKAAWKTSVPWSGTTENPEVLRPFRLPTPQRVFCGFREWKIDEASNIFWDSDWSRWICMSERKW